MKKRLIYILLNVFLWSTTYLYAQKQGQERIDSLFSELEKVKVDTSRVNILNQFIWQNTQLGNHKIAMEQGKEALDLVQNISFKKGIATPDKTGLLQEATRQLEQAAKDFKEQESLDLYQQTQNHYPLLIPSKEVTQRPLNASRGH